MFRKIFFFVITLFLGLQSQAQTEGYAITGNIKGLAAGNYSLAHYFGNTQYINKDTATVGSDGLLVFEGKKSLPSGLYMLMNPKKQKVLELVIGDEQRFSFESDTLNLIGNLKITGSRQNELFFEYQKQTKTYADEIGMLQAQAKMRNDGISQQLVGGKVAAIRRQMSDYYLRFTKENATSLAGKMLKASGDIELPTTLPKRPDGRPDSAWLFRYYKAHFWDNFDFAEESLVRTPFLQRKLDRYVGNLTYQLPDSIVAAAETVIGKALAGNGREMKAYCIWYLTNKYENPEIMGADAAFVHLAEKYYLGGIMPIVDSSTIQNIREKVKTLKPLLVGKTMPAIALADTTGASHSLAEIKANYTIVVFYDPDCGHCREATPILKEFYEKNKQTRGVQMLAVSVTRSPEQWKKYIREFGVGNWNHGYDFNFKIDFRRQFDVVTTPVVYVLDKDKTILARRLPAAQLEDFLNFHEAKLAVMAKANLKIDEKAEKVKGKTKGK